MRRRCLEGLGMTSFCTEAPSHNLKKNCQPSYLSILGLRTDASSWHINNQLTTSTAGLLLSTKQPWSNHPLSLQPVDCTWVSTNVNGAAFLGRRNAPSTGPSSKAKGMATWKQPSNEGGTGKGVGRQPQQQTTSNKQQATTTTTTAEEEEEENEEGEQEENEEWDEEGEEHMGSKKYLCRATLCLDLFNCTVCV